MADHVSGESLFAVDIFGTAWNYCASETVFVCLLGPKFVRTLMSILAGCTVPRSEYDLPHVEDGNQHGTWAHVVRFVLRFIRVQPSMVISNHGLEPSPPT
jgi:hypothetical protein